MVCHEFRNLIFERLGGELSSVQEAECSEHEQQCAICRAEFAQFKLVESRLRAGWPSEDPAPVHVPVTSNKVQTARYNWLDLAAIWFERASVTAVMACLVALLILRPSIEANHGSLNIAFAHDAARPEAQLTVTHDQLKTMVESEVNLEMARMQPAATSMPRP